MNLSPYREQAATENALSVAEQSKPLFGLIRANTHRCRLPSVFARLILWLMRKPINTGSHYRCSGCRKIYKLDWNRYSNCFRNWGEASERDWERAGGLVKEPQVFLKPIENPAIMVKHTGIGSTVKNV